MIPEIGLSEDGRKLRQLVSGLQNIELKEPDIENYEYMQARARGLRIKTRSIKKKGGK